MRVDNATKAPTSIERLAAWSLSRDSVYRSSMAMRQARLLLLDAIGCALAAFDGGNVDDVIEVATDLGGPPECTIIGVPRKVSVLNAVLANGSLVRVLDLNDIMFAIWNGEATVRGHPSDNIPIGLAVGEKFGSSIADVLEAIILSYQLFGDLRELMGYPTPFDGSSTAGIVGAAMTGRLMKLDPQRQAQALALGACRCMTPAVVRRGHVSATKSMANALVAQSGVLGALLAAKGATGPIGILDDEKAGLRGLFDRKPGLDDLWRSHSPNLEIMRSNVKSFPCIGTGQTAVHAALQVHAQLQDRTDEIESVEVIMADVAFVRNQQADERRRHPQTREAADHSFTFLPAVALLDGELTLRQFANERWKDPNTLRLMERVTLKVAPDLNERAPGAMPCRLRVVLKSGREIVAECLQFPGRSLETGIDPEIVKTKFRGVSRPMLTAERCESIISTVLGAKDEEPVSTLMALLSGTKNAAAASSRN